jgi:hypothetical protein
LAQPLEALRLLSDHRDDRWDGPTEPDDLDQEATDHDLSPHQSLTIAPPPIDPATARPRAIIYVHLSVEALTAGTGICRVENIGPVLLSRLQTLLGDHCSINLKPVIDLPAGHTPLDCYEIPASLREQLLLRYPVDVFPYANTITRAVDIDHTIPYLSPDEGGPPGQTRIGNLGPHVRYHHRVKTFAGWQVCQSEPGTWLWRSPQGRPGCRLQCLVRQRQVAHDQHTVNCTDRLDHRIGDLAVHIHQGVREFLSGLVGHRRDIEARHCHLV